MLSAEQPRTDTTLDERITLPATRVVGEPMRQIRVRLVPYEPRRQRSVSTVWPLLLALTLVLAACSSSHTPLETRAAAAALEAWDGLGLPEPRASCRIEAFRFEHPTTLPAFQRTCSAPGADPAKLMAWACLRWRLEAPRVRTILYPAGVLRPDLPEERWGAAAVHELMHALVDCSALGPWGDPYDAGHTDPRVWQATGGASSAQAVATSILEGHPAWPPE